MTERELTESDLSEAACQEMLTKILNRQPELNIQSIPTKPEP